MSSYHTSLDFITRSQLACFLRDRAEFESRYVLRNAVESEDTKASLIGSLVHALVLEYPVLGAAPIVSRYALPGHPSITRRSRRMWRLHVEKAEQRRLTPISFQEFEVAVRAAYNLFEDATLRTWFLAPAGIREQRFRCRHEESGLEIAMQGDLVIPMDEFVLCVDAKAMEEPRRFRSSARQFDYALQQVQYSHILAHHFERPVKFRYVVIGTKAPYRPRVIRLADETVGRARMRWHNGLIDLAECLRTGVFGSGKVETELVGY